MQESIKRLILIYFAAVNGAGFLSMGIDKHKARRGRWRTPEKTLFLIAVLGGSLGAILGMHVFHHKTKHKKFQLGMPAIFLLEAAAVLFLVFWVCCMPAGRVL
ncbi:MAG: DUF1294 domain-containing protein [Oscillospiraceae bacterium]|nr:DUF1294 domain-containing protein [Oscillospiraceae bacterium]